MGVPQAAVYRTSSSTYYAAKLLLRIPYVTLPNIVAGREIIPELLQNDCTPENIAAHVQRIWQDDEWQRMQAAYAELRQRLGEGGAVSRAARIVLDIGQYGSAAGER